MNRPDDNSSKGIGHMRTFIAFTTFFVATAVVAFATVGLGVA
jgi:hypothetical protein